MLTKLDDSLLHDLMRRDRHDAYLAAAAWCERGGFLIGPEQQPHAKSPAETSTALVEATRAG